MLVFPYSLLSQPVLKSLRRASKFELLSIYNIVTLAFNLCRTSTSLPHYHSRGVFSNSVIYQSTVSQVFYKFQFTLQLPRKQSEHRMEDFLFFPPSGFSVTFSSGRSLLSGGYFCLFVCHLDSPHIFVFFIGKASNTQVDSKLPI